MVSIDLKVSVVLHSVCISKNFEEPLSRNANLVNVLQRHS